MDKIKAHAPLSQIALANHTRLIFTTTHHICIKYTPLPALLFYYTSFLSFYSNIVVMNDDADLANQLNSFSISSSEERLAQDFDKTHISTNAPNTTPSIFASPSQFQQQAQQNATARSSFLSLSQTTVNNNNNNNNWNTASTAIQWDGNNVDWNNEGQNEQKDEEGGWGEGPPSYTSISQGTYFGFNSIMEAPTGLVAATNNTTDNSQAAAAAATAFSGFKNTPVTFTSAAAAVHQYPDQQQHK
jgi:hypothetical protein